MNSECSSIPSIWRRTSEHHTLCWIVEKTHPTTSPDTNIKVIFLACTSEYQSTWSPSPKSDSAKLRFRSKTGWSPNRSKGGFRCVYPILFPFLEIIKSDSVFRTLNLIAVIKDSYYPSSLVLVFSLPHNKLPEIEQLYSIPVLDLWVCRAEVIVGWPVFSAKGIWGWKPTCLPF